MQLNSLVLLIILSIIKSTSSKPTDTSLSPISSDDDKFDSANGELNSFATENKKPDYYVYRYSVMEGVEKALTECREKFKWDRWNCPKKTFSDIFFRSRLPSNKELGLTRALIASGIVLSLTQSCSYGTNSLCKCSPAAMKALPSLMKKSNSIGLASMNSNPQELDKNLDETQDNAGLTGNDQTIHESRDLVTDSSTKVTKFVWRGCEESIKFAFKVSKTYLENLDNSDNRQDESTRRINAHNYEVGRLAVKKNMKRVCKCHGVSGSCQVRTCWMALPDMSKVGEYLKRQYRHAAKVGAMTAVETNVESLNKELMALKKDKLVFAEASPDYCYENAELGINGTLGRYCSLAKHHADGTKVSRSERDSCDRLCTKCGYKIKKERFITEKQCDCRFVYCCSIECKRCPHAEDTYRCVKHS